VLISCRAALILVVLFAGIGVSYKPAWTTTAAASSTDISRPLSYRAAAAARSAPARELGEVRITTFSRGITPTTRVFGQTAPTDARTSETRDSIIPQVNFGTLPMPLPSLSVDGLINFDNVDAYNLLFLPPDMTGDIGPDHYVQAVNALFRVYDRSGESPNITDKA
jgi:hypothetical protein